MGAGRDTVHVARRYEAKGWKSRLMVSLEGQPLARAVMSGSQTKRLTWIIDFRILRKGKVVLSV